MPKSKVQPDWEERFEVEFPPFRGVGAPFPIFRDTPVRSHIVQFIAQVAKDQYQLGQADLRAELKKKVEGMKGQSVPFIELDPASKQQDYFEKLGAMNALDAVLKLLESK